MNARTVLMTGLLVTALVAPEVSAHIGGDGGNGGLGQGGDANCWLMIVVFSDNFCNGGIGGGGDGGNGGNSN